MSDLRRQVLDAALEVIIDKGLASLSFREVARRAGVSHQAPYHHFGDKESIYAAIAAEGYRMLASALRTALAGGTPIEAFRRSGRAYVNFALTHPAHYRVMFRPDLVRAERFPDLQQAGAEAWSELEETVARLRQSGRAELHDPSDLTTLLWSSVHGAAMLVLDGPLPARGSHRSGAQVAEGVVDTLVDLLR